MGALLSVWKSDYAICAALGYENPRWPGIAAGDVWAAGRAPGQIL